MSPIQYHCKLHYPNGHWGCSRARIYSAEIQRERDCSWEIAGCGRVTVVSQSHIKLIFLASLLTCSSLRLSGGGLKWLTFFIGKKQIPFVSWHYYCNQWQAWVRGPCWCEAVAAGVGALVNMSGLLITLDDLWLVTTAVMSGDKVVVEHSTVCLAPWPNSSFFIHLLKCSSLVFTSHFTSFIVQSDNSPFLPFCHVYVPVWV